MSLRQRMEWLERMKAELASSLCSRGPVIRVLPDDDPRVAQGRLHVVMEGPQQVIYCSEVDARC